MTQLLKQTEDATRILQKFFLGKGDIDDLLAIKDTINVWNKMRDTVQLELSVKPESTTAARDRDTLRVLMEKFADLGDLAERITAALDEGVTRRKDSTSPAEDIEDPSASENLEDVQSWGIGSRPWTIRPEQVYARDPSPGVALTVTRPS